MKYLYIIILIFFNACNFVTSNDYENNTNVVSDSIKINFNQNKIKKDLQLNNIFLLGSIETNNNRWVILKGDIKDDTYQDIGIYIYPLKESSIPDSIINFRYSYPGKKYNYNGNLIYESRVFFGECTEKNNNSIIWYQSELIKEKWDTNYFVIHFKNDSVIFNRLDKKKIKINILLKNYKEGKCEEIPGIKYYVEP